MVAAGDLATFSDVVAGLYACALSPSSWPEAIAAVATYVGGEAATLGFHAIGESRIGFHVSHGFDAAFLDRMPDYQQSSPIFAAAPLFDEGEVFSLGDVISYDEYLDGRLHRELAAPHGWFDSVTGVVTRRPDRLGFVGVALRERATRDHVAKLRELMPHLKGATDIADLFEFQAVRLDALERMLDTAAFGAVLLGAGGHIQHANAAARAMLADCGDVRIESGRLVCDDGSGGRRLSVLVSAHLDTGSAAASDEIVLARLSGAGDIAARILPLHPVRADAPVAALFLTATSPPSRAPLAAIADAYALTFSETRILMAVAEGQTPREIADRYGNSVATIRTHLQRIYGKTGTAGRVELLRLLTGLESRSAVTSGIGQD